MRGELDREAAGCLYFLIKMVGLFAVVFWALIICHTIFIG